MPARQGLSNTPDRAHRIEVGARGQDPWAGKALRTIAGAHLSNGLEGLRRIEAYSLRSGLSGEALVRFAEALRCPISQDYRIDGPLESQGYQWVIRVAFLPGVTDNAGQTAWEILQVLEPGGGTRVGAVHTETLYLATGALREDQVQRIAALFGNPLIHEIQVLPREKYLVHLSLGLGARAGELTTMSEEPESRGFGPERRGSPEEGPSTVVRVDLNVSPEELEAIGRAGILESTPDGDVRRRGPLALDLPSMKTIQKHFAALGRDPSDVELEALAQSWSEHCRHRIFNAPLDETSEGLYERYIKGATRTICEARDDGFCVSVFTDNSGAVVFDEDHLVTDKVETHNSPSALDPFGGALTGILGVNRDALGFGLGARPVANRYGFCLPFPNEDQQYYRDPERRRPLIPTSRMLEELVEGVEVGGNHSGVPTPQGFFCFHESYRAKPLVFVGTVGLIPRRLPGGRPSHQKRARPGDRIVVAGGRVGRDGIHGATFSSGALDAHSPCGAVQIGDPITQKRMTEALLREARDAGLYSSLTDNGAGGLSCSVSEMARESGGFDVDLDAVPLKYPGLEAWQIWISESQERMTLAVSPERVDELQDLFRRHGVESAVIGRFTDSGRGIVRRGEETVLDLDLDFLNEGYPKRPLKSWRPQGGPERGRGRPRPPRTSAAAVPGTSAGGAKVDHGGVLAGRRAAAGRPGAGPEKPGTRREATVSGDGAETGGGPLGRVLLGLLGRPGIAGFAFVSRRFDHEVRGGSVLPPLQGPGRVNADVTVTRPLPGSRRAVALSQALAPRLTELHPYTMAVCSVDQAVRNLVACGARLDRMALLDNFCWSRPFSPERLWQLREAARGCHDLAVIYGTPFISGKDSMHNDFHGYDDQGRPVGLSIVPTLLISGLAVVEDALECVSLDPKAEGDRVYLLGDFGPGLAGSEYAAWMGDDEAVLEDGLPRVDGERFLALYQAVHRQIRKGRVASALSPGRGGLAVALARMAVAGQVGLELDLSALWRSEPFRGEALLFGEPPGLLVVTASPEDGPALEVSLQREGVSVVALGTCTGERRFEVRGLPEGSGLDLPLETLEAAYRSWEVGLHGSMPTN